MKNLKEYASLVNARLEELLPKLPEGSCEKGEGMPWLLADAMRYSLLAGGKRLRPCMLLAAVDMLGGDIDEALDFACCGGDDSHLFPDSRRSARHGQRHHAPRPPHQPRGFRRGSGHSRGRRLAELRL